MPFDDTRTHLSDILESIQAIERFVSAMTLEASAEDEKTQAAVERKLQILSEAAVRLKDNAEPLCPFSAMAGRSGHR
jgi:uncharacterized protein with HEPN domain